MTRNEWVVSVTSFLEGLDKPFTHTEITMDTRKGARQIMAAQKLLATHSILRTQVDLYRVKTVDMWSDGTNITRFYTKAR